MLGTVWTIVQLAFFFWLAVCACIVVVVAVTMAVAAPISYLVQRANVSWARHARRSISVDDLVADISYNPSYDNVYPSDALVGLEYFPHAPKDTSSETDYTEAITQMIEMDWPSTTSFASLENEVNAKGVAKILQFTRKG